MPDDLVTADALGAWLAEPPLSGRRVRALAAASVIPRATRGRYPLRAAIVAYCSRLREEAAGRRGEGDLDLVQERARLARAQAELAEIRAAEMRGELIPAGQLEEALCSLSSAVVLRLRAVPVKAAPQCGAARSDAEREAIIRGHIDEACNALAAHLAGED